MSQLLVWEIWFIQAFQNLGDWLTPVMKLFTWLGYPQAYMVIIAIIYWSVNPKLGMRMAVFLFLTASVNGLLKQVIHAPRPYWIDSRIKAIMVSNGFGMPSGHAQGATVWLLTASILRKKWFWVCAIILTLMIGLSRAFLGVHFPSQVILGWLIGIILIWLFLRFEEGIVSWMSNRKLYFQILFVFLLSLLIILLGAFFIRLNGDWQMPAEWVSNSSVYLGAAGESILSSIGLKAIAGNAGGFFGTVLGIILIKRTGGMTAGGTLWQHLLRCISGIALLAGLYLGLQYIAPDEQNPELYCIWRYAGFSIIAFSVFYLIPLVHLELKLRSSENQADA